jgi:hypothetical protein
MCIIGYGQFVYKLAAVVRGIARVDEAYVYIHIDSRKTFQ